MTFRVFADHKEVSRHDLESDVVDGVQRAVKLAFLRGRSSLISADEVIAEGQPVRPIVTISMLMPVDKREPIPEPLNAWLCRVHYDWYHAQFQEENSEPDLLYASEHLEAEGYPTEKEGEYTRLVHQLKWQIEEHGGLTKIIQLIDVPAYTR